MKPAPRVIFDLGNLSDSVEDERRRMQLMLKLYRPRAEVKKAIHDAYNDPRWDWTKCDGCTLVDEAHSPKGTRFPPCVMHDHWCWKADQAKTIEEARRIRRKGDKLFFQANMDFRINPARAGIRWTGVRLYWLLWVMWFWKSKT